MATQALYRKWRSQTFEEVIGQQHVTRTLQNAIAADRVGHAYLFTGPRGTGKTSTARLLAKAVNCTGETARPCNACSICLAVNEGRLIDLIEIDAASNTSVDDIRDLRDKVDFRPGEASIKFYIIDEVHMLSKSAFNALLKTLEEPPPHVVFVLATTEPEKIPATITSRCQRFDFRRIKLEDVVGRLRFIVEQEGLKAEEEALTLIARQGGGSMRDSISLLDQLMAYGQEVLTLDVVRSVLGAADNRAIMRLVSYLLQDDAGAALSLVNEVVQNGVEPRQFALDIVEYLRGLLLIKYDNGAQFLNLSLEITEAMRPQAAAVSASNLLAFIERFNQAVVSFKSGAGEVAIPQLPLELAVVDVTTGAEQAENVPLTTPSAEAEPQTAPLPAAASIAPASQAAAPTEEAAPPPIKPAGPAGISLSDVQARWNAIGAELKRQNMGMVQGLLNSGQIIALKEDTLVISFPSDLLKQRVDRFKSTILETIERVLGSAIRIEFVVGAESPSSEPPPETAAKKTPVESFADDPLVKSALDLGGKIKGTVSLDDVVSSS